MLTLIYTKLRSYLQKFINLKVILLYKVKCDKYL